MPAAFLPWFLFSTFFFFLNDLAWQEIIGSEPSSPKPDAPSEFRGALGGAAGRWSVGEHPSRRANLEGKTFPRIGSRCSPPGGPGTRACPLLAPSVQPAAALLFRKLTGFSRARAEPVAGAGDGGRAALEAELPLRQVRPRAAGRARAVSSTSSWANREKPAKPRGPRGWGGGKPAAGGTRGGKMDSQALRGERAPAGRPRSQVLHAPHPAPGRAHNAPAKRHSRSLPSTCRRAPVGRGERRGPPGLCEGQRSVPKGAELQHQVPHAEAVRGGQGDQLQLDLGPGGQGRVPQRHGGPQTEVALQLPLQAGYEEGEELPANLLEHVPEPAGYAWLSSSPSPSPQGRRFPRPRGLADLILCSLLPSCRMRTFHWPRGTSAAGVFCLPRSIVGARLLENPGVGGGTSQGPC